MITRSAGGSEASAMAANVSMMRFTQSICVTVSGESVPMKAPANTMKQAATFNRHLEEDETLDVW